MLRCLQVRLLSFVPNSDLAQFALFLLPLVSSRSAPTSTRLLSFLPTESLVHSLGGVRQHRLLSDTNVAHERLLNLD